MENTGLMMYEENGMTIDFAAGSKSAYCSFKGDSDEAKALMFRAMNNPDKRIGDCINEEINMKDIYAEVVTCTNKETGEKSECPRVVIIDTDGISYQSVSIGVYQAIQKLIRVFGQPTYKNGLKIKVLQKTIGERKMLTFDVVAKK